MGMPPPVPTVHCCVCYPEKTDYLWGSVRRDEVCVAFSRGINRKIQEKQLPRELLRCRRDSGWSGGGFTLWSVRRKSQKEKMSQQLVEFTYGCYLEGVPQGSVWGRGRLTSTKRRKLPGRGYQKGVTRKGRFGGCLMP